MRGGRYRYLFAALFFLLFLTPSKAQKKTRQGLEQEKLQNLERIEEFQKILESTGKEKDASVGKLNAINAQINSRRSLIRSMQEEVDLYDEEITETEEIIEALSEDLAQLKKEYAEMVYASYKANQNQNFISFLFASSTVNQLIRRVQYFEQYSKARKDQANQIQKVQMVLEIELDDFQIKKTEKASLLAEQLKEQEKLKSLQSQQNRMVVTLSRRENELRSELKERENAVARINKLIEEVIKEELRIAEAAANAANAANAAELASLSTTFQGNQQNLPWPVDQGFVSMGFGRQQHPVLKLVEVDNKGIYIQTLAKEEIKAVFNGRVSVVASIPGMNKAVIIQHGDYRTVYANLKEVFVTRNQQIETNQAIGEVYTDSQGQSELYFEVWKSNKTLNPQNWLAKK